MGDHKRPKLGPTGEFPQGKLNHFDEGELEFGIANDGKKVIINFNSPVFWFAVQPAMALQMAEALTRHAMAVKNKGG
jgi:hypothetical protein